MKNQFKCCTCSTYFPIESNTLTTLVHIRGGNPDDRLIYASCKQCEASGQIQEKIVSQRLLDRPKREVFEHAVTSELAYITNNGNLLNAINFGLGLPFEAYLALTQGGEVTVGVPGFGLIQKIGGQIIVGGYK